jgi:type I restriction enzyme M protein
MAKRNNRKSNGAVLGFEQALWEAVDKLCNNMDAAEYKHVVLGLIFLRCIPPAFEEHGTKLSAGKDSGTGPEDSDGHRAFNIFWVPKEARRSHLQANAKRPTIGKLINDAMVAIQKERRSNELARGVGHVN